MNYIAGAYYLVNYLRFPRSGVYNNKLTPEIQIPFLVRYHIYLTLLRQALFSDRPLTSRTFATELMIEDRSGIYTPSITGIDVGPAAQLCLLSPRKFIGGP